LYCSWFRKAAELGDVEAQFYLAIMLKNGDGIKRDTADATRWFRKIAEQEIKIGPDIEKELLSRN
jgi:TPR repeat protein